MARTHEGMANLSIFNLVGGNDIFYWWRRLTSVEMNLPCTTTTEYTENSMAANFFTQNTAFYVI